jgi:hypothetical protein
MNYWGIIENIIIYCVIGAVFAYTGSTWIFLLLVFLNFPSESNHG